MTAAAVTPKDRLIVALDVDTRAEAMALVRQLGAAAGFYKVGLQLFMENGLHIVRELVESGKKVFLDLKIDDTPRTVQEAVRNIAIDGVEFFTLQGNADTAKAAREGRAGKPTPRFLQVTFLSSWDANDLREYLHIGASEPGVDIDERVVDRARRILAAGSDGVIASGSSVKRLRQAYPELLIVTPGIRPAGVKTDDHKRSLTPFDAIAAGADYLVVGRPIRAAKDSSGTARQIVEDIERALHGTRQRVPGP
jgi:orotidine-5'-phosphate decarboxylase